METPAPIQQIDRTWVLAGNRKLSYFAGCDYFRLASHPKVLRAINDGLRKFGLNVAASRMTTGNHELYGELETTLEKFFDVESAMLVSNGYATNLIAAQALAGEFSNVLIDEKAHPSLKDAAKFFAAPVQIFKHRDAEDLQQKISRLAKGNPLIVLTDGMFSHDGSIAPLKAYCKILPKNSWLLVDDAHGAGTLGNTGKGSLELEGINRGRVIQTITLSKAFGAYGGAILGPRQLREKILAKSGMFVGSTPLPLPLAHASAAAIEILQRDKGLRQRLVKNVSYVKRVLSEAGFAAVEGPGPIIPIVPKNIGEAEQLKKRCLKNGVFPSFIKYPSGAADGYFRFVISSEHTKAQLDAWLETLIAH